MLPRVYELKDAVSDVAHPQAYFRNFEACLTSGHTVIIHYVRIERQLRELHDDAWLNLKHRAMPHLTAPVPGRGWQALFDTLNEAKGYAYLKRMGCEEIAFINKQENIKTPDLRATLNGALALCEVKTINIGDDEAQRRRRVAEGEIFVSHVSAVVEHGFLAKVTSTLTHGVSQLDCYDPDRKARRVIFVVLHFNDWVGDYQTEYIAQLDSHMLQNPVEGAEVVLNPASNLFNRHFTMKSAPVVLDWP